MKASNSPWQNLIQKAYKELKLAQIRDNFDEEGSSAIWSAIFADVCMDELSGEAER